MSKKNPAGSTIVDEHSRRLSGTYLDLKGLTFPSSGKLIKYLEADKHDELIAIWTDYFNKKFPSNKLLDPDVVKALIGSESDFKLDPKNSLAFGIAQITKLTFKALKDPKIAIPMAVRWLFRKKRLALGKLGKEPNDEEIILEYKGLLNSRSDYKNSALKKIRELYELLKK